MLNEESTQIPQLLKVPDVASILNISSSQAYRLVSRNKIASVRIGHSVRVQPDDLQAFIQAQTTQTN